MNSTARNLILFAVFVGTACFILHEMRSFARASTHPAPQVQTQAATPQTITHTVSVMPGQAFNVPNRRFRKVEVRADYPLRVYSGRCHDDYTVEFYCIGEPGDIFVTDTRHRPLFTTPRANSVTITVTEF